MSCISIFFTQKRDKVHFDKQTSSTQSTFYFVESFRKCAVYQIINKLFIYKQGRSYSATCASFPSLALLRIHNIVSGLNNQRPCILKGRNTPLSSPPLQFHQTNSEMVVFLSNSSEHMNIFFKYSLLCLKSHNY